MHPLIHSYGFVIVLPEMLYPQIKILPCGFKKTTIVAIRKLKNVFTSVTHCDWSE